MIYVVIGIVVTPWFPGRGEAYSYMSRDLGRDLLKRFLSKIIEGVFGGMKLNAYLCIVIS